MQKALLLLLFLATASIFIYGQKNFKPGFIIKPGNDTVRGEIDYKKWELNPTKIIFRTAEGTKEEAYTKYEIEGFGVNGFDRYIRTIVMMDMNPVAVNDLVPNQTNVTVTDTAFLRVLVAGNRLNLYEFVNFKPHYFIQPAGGKAEELVYKISVDATSGKLITNNGFRTQLKNLLTTAGVSPDQLKKVNSLEYELKDLVKFTSSVNEPSGVYVPLDMKKSKGSIQVFAGAGVVSGTLGFEGPNEELNSLVFDPTVSFLMAGGVDIFSARNMQKFFLRAELTVRKFGTDGKGTSGINGTTTLRNNEFSMEQVNITPAVSLNYSFVNTGTVKLFAGVGMGFNFSSYPKQSYVSTNALTGAVSKKDDFPVLRENWVSIFARIGVVISKKIELGLNRQMGGSFISYVNISETYDPVSLHLYYRFR